MDTLTKLLADIERADASTPFFCGYVRTTALDCKACRFGKSKATCGELMVADIATRLRRIIEEAE